VFVVRGVAVGTSHSWGNALPFPAAGVIQVALGTYRLAPASYRIDFGVWYSVHIFFADVILLKRFNLIAAVYNFVRQR